MILVIILTAILKSLGVAVAISLWAWFASHLLITILLVLFLA